MARARDPNRDKAFEIYKEHDGNITNRAIAEMLDVMFQRKQSALGSQRLRIIGTLK